MLQIPGKPSEMRNQEVLYSIFGSFALTFLLLLLLVASSICVIFSKKNEEKKMKQKKERKTEMNDMRKKAKKRWLLFSRQIGGLFKNTFRRGGGMELAQVENEPRAREKSEEDIHEEGGNEDI